MASRGKMANELVVLRKKLSVLAHQVREKDKEIRVLVEKLLACDREEEVERFAPEEAEVKDGVT